MAYDHIQGFPGAGVSIAMNGDKQVLTLDQDGSPVGAANPLKISVDGLPALPTPDEGGDDDGKFLGIDGNEYTLVPAPEAGTELPPVTGGDDGKLLGVEGGEYALVDAPSPGGGATSLVLAPTHSEDEWSGGAYNTSVGNAFTGGGTILDGMSGSYDSPGGLHRIDFCAPNAAVGISDKVFLNGATTGEAQITVNGETASIPWDTDAAGLQDILKFLNGIDQRVYVSDNDEDGFDLLWSTNAHPEVSIVQNTLDTVPTFTPSTTVDQAGFFFIISPATPLLQIVFDPLIGGGESSPAARFAIVDLGSPGTITLAAVLGGFGGTAYVSLDDTPGTGQKMAITVTPIQS